MVAGRTLKTFAVVLAAAVAVALAYYLVFGVFQIRIGVGTFFIGLVAWQLARGRIYRADTYVDNRMSARRARVAAARRRAARSDTSIDDGDDPRGGE